MNSLTKLGLVALVAVTAISSGCSKNPKNITPLPGSGAQAPGGDPVLGKPITGGPNNPGVGRGNLFNNGNDPGTRALPTETTSPTNLKGNQSELPTGSDFGAGKTEDTTTLAADTVYFDYDKAAVKTSELPKLTNVADYLKAHPQADLKVEGHCDERGTEEYNRALGERRALAVRERLVNLGVKSDRVTTVSFGEEKPADPGHDEAAFAKNRRGEFILLVPPGLR